MGMFEAAQADEMAELEKANDEMRDVLQTILGAYSNELTDYLTERIRAAIDEAGGE